ncbi:hypothetical protein YC2023_101748 [Brassica napus]
MSTGKKLYIYFQTVSRAIAAVNMCNVQSLTDHGEGDCWYTYNLKSKQIVFHITTQLLNASIVMISLNFFHAHVDRKEKENPETMLDEDTQLMEQRGT